VNCRTSDDSGSGRVTNTGQQHCQQWRALGVQERRCQKMLLHQCVTDLLALHLITRACLAPQPIEKKRLRIRYAERLSPKELTL
jgi:hypothetical protein